MYNRLPLFAKHTYVSDEPIVCDGEGHLLVSSVCTGIKAFSTKAPTSASAMLLLAAHPTRVLALIRNVGDVDVYLGDTNAITTATGYLLQRGGEVFTDTFSVDAWYGITVSGTADLRIIEVS